MRSVEWINALRALPVYPVFKDDNIETPDENRSTSLEKKRPRLKIRLRKSDFYC